MRLSAQIIQYNFKDLTSFQNNLYECCFQTHVLDFLESYFFHLHPCRNGLAKMNFIKERSKAYALHCSGNRNE